LNVQLLTGRDRVGSLDRIIGYSVACVVASCGRLCSAYSGVARGMPGKLLDNGYGMKKAGAWLALVIYGPFQGRTE
jgi:hypothetical protein